MRLVTLLVLCAAMLLFVSGAIAGSGSKTDSLIVENVTVTKGGTVAVKIEFVNTVDLGAVTVPLRVKSKGTTIDSVSFAGGRLEYLRAKPVTIAEDKDKVVFGAICMTEAYVAPGRGHLATVYLTVPDAVMSNPITIDTVTIHPATLLFTKSNSLSYVPHFVPGLIGAAAPSESDSTK